MNSYYWNNSKITGYLFMMILFMAFLYINNNTLALPNANNAKIISGAKENIDKIFSWMKNNTISIKLCMFMFLQIGQYAGALICALTIYFSNTWENYLLHEYHNGTHTCIEHFPPKKMYNGKSVSSLAVSLLGNFVPCSGLLYILFFIQTQKLTFICERK